MKITNRFTIGIHIIVATAFFQDNYTVTSSFIAESVGANPVLIRTIISSLKEEGILDISQGKTGIRIKKALDEITFYDVYKVIDFENEGGLFNFHDKPNGNCPVGKNIHKALDDKLDNIQKSMENEMKKLKISDVYDVITKEIKGEK